MSKLDNRIAAVFPECDTPRRINDKLWELSKKLGNNATARIIGVNKATVSRRLALIRVEKGV